MPAATPEPTRFRISRFQYTVRIAGGLLLTAAAVMLVLGLTVLADALQGFSFVVYWSWCFLVALAAIGVAVLDFFLLRRAYQRTRRELYRREFAAGNVSLPPAGRDASPRRPSPARGPPAG